METVEDAKSIAGCIDSRSHVLDMASPELAAVRQKIAELDEKVQTRIKHLLRDPELRKILYTTNAIESLNAQVRKAVRIRGHFPSEEAATKLIWLVLRKIQTRWKSPPTSWHAAKAQLAIQFEDRFVVID